MDLYNTIQDRARKYADENISNPPTASDYLLIQNAMMIGANIALETCVKEAAFSRSVDNVLSKIGKF